VHPIDVQGRKLLAAERFQLLATDAQVSRRPAENLRRRLGKIVIAVGLRLVEAGYSKNVNTARITYSEISATPSNRVASPSPVICQSARAVRSSAPM
jgi:hypothetical protein